ncbi:TPA: hypothetical protein ACPWFX_005560 [Pseudomonas aeruginosa]
MTKANECTCPSGDGSLRHPCPAHPAVEQAGGDERAVDGKPRATKCPDCGEGDLMPGDLCACGYETDPAAGCACPECDGSGDGCVGEVCRECDGSGWVERPEQARAALAQPSPASDLDPLNLAPHAGAFNEAPDEALRPEQAEAEQPVVVGYRSGTSGGIYADGYGLEKPEPLMTVAQHERIVAFRWERAMDLMGEHVARISEKLTAERDAALARVAELEKQEPVAHLRASDLERLNQPGIAGSAGSLWNGPREGFVPLYAAPVAQAGQVPTGWYYDAPSQVEAVIIDIRGMWGEDDCPTYEDVAAALRRLLAAAPGKEGV